MAAAFDFFDADAVTVSPYLGSEALKPFLDQRDKGIIVLCRTSNPGAGEFQDVIVSTGKEEYFKRRYLHVSRHIPLYQYVAHRVASSWNTYGNCALVVGATYPQELGEVREIVGDDMPILIPGIGAQGGDVEKTVQAGKDSRGRGMIINSSSAIIYADKTSEGFAAGAREKTQELHQAISEALDGGK